jgi:transcriptional regulator with XRE-family HTH domain
LKDWRKPEVRSNIRLDAVIASMSISPAQLKEARRLLGWTLSVVGGKSDLSTSTISFFETGRRRPSALGVSKIRKAFEAAGVEFIAENGEGTGVRLRKDK